MITFVPSWPHEVSFLLKIMLSGKLLTLQIFLYLFLDQYRTETNVSQKFNFDFWFLYEKQILFLCVRWRLILSNWVLKWLWVIVSKLLSSKQNKKNLPQLALPPTGTSPNWQFPKLALYAIFLCYWESESPNCRYTRIERFK